MTNLGAFFIGIGIWWGLSALGSRLDDAAQRLKEAVEYVVDNWGIFEEETPPGAESTTEPEKKEAGE